MHWTRWNTRNKASVTSLFRYIFVAVTIPRCRLISLLPTVEVHMVWIVRYCQSSKPVNTWIISGNMFTVFVTTHSEDQEKLMQASPQNHKFMTVTACSLVFPCLHDWFLPRNKITFWPKQFPQRSHYYELHSWIKLTFLNLLFVFTINKSSLSSFF